MKQAIEYLLFRSNISNYQISQATGLSQVLLSKYSTGKSDIGRMTLDNAIKLYNYFKEVLEMMEYEYGKIIFEGKEYILSEDAYLTHVSKPHENGAWLEGDFYQAKAIDNDGNEYIVLWKPVDNWQELEDAFDHCDWKQPKYVIAL